MMVTTLTTNCCIKVLREDDWIVVKGVKYLIGNDYTNVNHESFAGLVTEITSGSGVEVSTDWCRRFVLTSAGEFTVDDASYNVRLMMGLEVSGVLDVVGVFSGSVYRYVVDTVGFTLSTPVLYLTSNIGQNSYMNVGAVDDSIQSARIVMRLNNSFSANYPISANNGEFSTSVSSGDLTSIEFRLVDANMRAVELLSPMYLSISVKGIPDPGMTAYGRETDWVGMDRVSIVEGMKLANMSKEDLKRREEQKRMLALMEI